MAASNKSRIRAESLDRMRLRLERQGVAASIRIGSLVMRDAGLAFKAGEDPADAVRLRLSELVTLLTEGMVAGHLRGRLTVTLAAVPKIREARNLQVMAGPFPRNIEFLRRRLEATPQQIQDLAAKYGNEAARITRVASGAVEGAARQAVQASAEAQETVRAGTARLRTKLARAGLAAPTAAQGGPHLFETLWRTAMQTSFNAGRWQAAQDPAIEEILWGWEYVTVGDDRVRPTHESVDGTKKPKDDPFWDAWWPPSGFNCRCGTVEVFRDDPAALATTPPTTTEDAAGNEIPVVPDKGFAFNSGKVFNDLVPAGVV